MVLTAQEPGGSVSSETSCRHPSCTVLRLYWNPSLRHSSMFQERNHRVVGARPGPKDGQHECDVLHLPILSNRVALLR
jgi:hypothetical protein